MCLLLYLVHGGEDLPRGLFGARNVQQRTGRSSDLPAGSAHGLFPGDAAGLLLQGPELPLGPGQRIMDALARDRRDPRRSR